MPEIRLAQAPPMPAHGSNIGQPLTRRDGVLKVTGRSPLRRGQPSRPACCMRCCAVSTHRARPREHSSTCEAAKSHPGVVEVMTPANRPPLAGDPDAKTNPFMFRMELLQNDRVRYANQPIAVVIAETLEAATEGAALLSPRYEVEPARVGLDVGEVSCRPPSASAIPPNIAHGDVEAGLAAALEAHRRDLRDAVAIPQRDGAARHRRGMGRRPPVDRHAEPGPCHGPGAASPGCSASRRKTCIIRSAVPRRRLRIERRSRGPQILGVLAARWSGRPVKLVLTRANRCTGRSAIARPTRQRLRIGMDGDGRLTAIDHHAKSATSSFDDFFEPAADASHTLYASPAIATSHEAVRIDIGTPLFMRAPGEATGSIALESAIDEAAWACGMDPLAFRLAELCRGRADLRQAVLLEGAARMLRARRRAIFGWSRRPLAPRQMRDEAGLLVGWGMGTATFPALMFAGRGARGGARRRLRHDGDRRPRHGPGRLDRARADRGRRPRARPRAGRVQGRHLRPAGRRHRRRLGPYRDRRHGDPQCGRSA